MNGILKSAQSDPDLAYQELAYRKLPQLRDRDQTFYQGAGTMGGLLVGGLGGAVASGTLAAKKDLGPGAAIGGTIGSAALGALAGGYLGSRKDKRDKPAETGFESVDKQELVDVAMKHPKLERGHIEGWL